MSLRSLQAMLRSLADAAPEVSDGELLRRFLQKDERAFAEIVRRHGRLVWTVCRHLSKSDAEADDSFQATFLILLRNARSVRNSSRLSSWLHGVAYKVCAKARQAAKRRTQREQVVAIGNHNGSTVPDSAWDRALSAAHTEAARLPESLRLPFVLCCLEGKGVSEAAEQLGWKLGTLSGRLTRAKDAVIAKLNARGLSVGVLAGLGLTAPPTQVTAKTTALAQIGFVVPKSILQLAQGVIGMSICTIKQLAAVVMLTGLLGLGLGTHWTASADAQSVAKEPPAMVDPIAEVKRLQAELDRARAASAEAAKQQERHYVDALRSAEDLFKIHEVKTDEAPTAKTTKWEYDFVVVSDMDQTKFVKFLQDRENRGWEFNGTTPLKDGEKQQIWIFRRPAKRAAALHDYGNLMLPTVRNFDHFTNTTARQLDNPKAIESEIARLQEQLAELKAKSARSRVVFAKDNLPLEPTEMMSMLAKLAEKKFAKNRFSLSASSSGVTLESDKEVIDWMSALLKKLSEK